MAPCSASATSHSTANSSCPGKRTVSTRKRSPRTSRSASAHAKRCATRAPSSTAGNCAPSTSRRSGNDRKRTLDRKSVVEGKSVSVRVDLGGRRIIKKKKKQHEQIEQNQ